MLDEQLNLKKNNNKKKTWKWEILPWQQKDIISYYYY